jgi:hypothetical protein
VASSLEYSKSPPLLQTEKLGEEDYNPAIQGAFSSWLECLPSDSPRVCV